MALDSKIQRTKPFIAPGKGSKATKTRNERRRRLKSSQWLQKVREIRIKKHKKKAMDFQSKLNFNAIECEYPFNYAPKVPRYPYDQDPIEQLSENQEVVPLIDVSGFKGREPSGAYESCSVNSGDVIYIYRFGIDPYSYNPSNILDFAQVHSVSNDELSIRVAESCLTNGTLRKRPGESSFEIDYGDREVEISSILSIEVIRRDVPLIILNHFDVQM